MFACMCMCISGSQRLIGSTSCVIIRVVVVEGLVGM